MTAVDMPTRLQLIYSNMGISEQEFSVQTERSGKSPATTATLATGMPAHHHRHPRACDIAAHKSDPALDRMLRRSRRTGARSVVSRAVPGSRP
jgi:hypothetical protein